MYAPVSVQFGQFKVQNIFLPMGTLRQLLENKNLLRTLSAWIVKKYPNIYEPVQPDLKNSKFLYAGFSCVSICVRRQYSTSKRQKRSLHWTLRSSRYNTCNMLKKNGERGELKGKLQELCRKGSHLTFLRCLENNQQNRILTTSPAIETNRSGCFAVSSPKKIPRATKTSTRKTLEWNTRSCKWTMSNTSWTTYYKAFKYYPLSKSTLLKNVWASPLWP